MRILAVFALVCAAAVVASDASYSIRIYNECSDQLRLADAQSNATIGVYPPQTVTLVKIGIPSGASRSVVLNLPTGQSIWSHAGLSTDAGKQFSVVALMDQTILSLEDTMDIANNDGIDIARFRVINAAGTLGSVKVSGVTENCHNCRLPPLCFIPYGQFTNGGTCSPSVGVLVNDADGYLLFDVRHYFNVELFDPDGNLFYKETLNLKEHSTHTLFVTLRGTSMVATLYQDLEGNKIWIPLVIAICVIAGVAIVYTILSALWLKKGERDREESARSDGHIQQPLSTKPKSGGRILGVDTFRGIALCIMIFVNYGGGGYWFLDHSRWYGLTVADLVFPWFMWMMGVSMAMSMATQRRQNHPRGAMSLKIIVRSIKLFGLGMFLNGGFDLGNWRVLGVLQYFGVACLINGLVEIWMPVLDGGCGCRRARKDADEDERREPTGGSLYAQLLNLDNADTSLPGSKRDAWSKSVADFWPYRLHFLLMACLLVAYLMLQYFLPVPGCPTGYTGPGGLAMPPEQAHCTGGAHRLIDYKIFGAHHIYHNLAEGTNIPVSAATCGDTYGCAVYDPEGTLGFLTATVMTFLGLQAGRIIVNYKNVSPWAMVKRWVAWGLVLCAIATGLCGGTKNDGVMPLCKNLWSPSFIACMAGTGFLALCLSYVLVDYLKWWSGAPFRFVGMNSIIVYAGSEILQGYFPFSFQDHSSSDNLIGGSGAFMTHGGALASNIVGVATWCFIAYLFNRNNFFYNL